MIVNQYTTTAPTQLEKIIILTKWYLPFEIKVTNALFSLSIIFIKRISASFLLSKSDVCYTA